MAFTSTQYLFKPSTFTATTTATQGSSTATTADGYTVPASTKFSIVALTLTNTATTNLTTYADIQLYNGTSAYTLVSKAQLYVGGTFVVDGIEKHILPSGGAVYITPYSTFVSAHMSGVEIT